VVPLLLLDPVVVLPLVLLDPVVVVVGPPSGGGLQGPQVPCALPTGTMQVSPGQQSAFTVHGPHVGTHVFW
jgi:hypothetical protein